MTRQEYDAWIAQIDLCTSIGALTGIYADMKELHRKAVEHYRRTYRYDVFPGALVKHTSKRLGTLRGEL